MDKIGWHDKNMLQQKLTELNKMKYVFKNSGAC